MGIKDYLLNKKEQLLKAKEERKTNQDENRFEDNLTQTTSNAIIEVLDNASREFFPKDGTWYSNCFRRPIELSMSNLPCHLRDDLWLAKMFQQKQKLGALSSRYVLNYVRNSDVFNEARHDYEMEIVKWQIKFMIDGGEGWICDDEYGGDFINFSTVCDLGFRKGVVDTLSKIGMNCEAIEEGIEKNVSLWRDAYMDMAFRNEYDPIFFCYDLFGSDESLDINKPTLENVDPLHKDTWLKYRRYEYYQRHKDSVDKYGVVLPEMKMSLEEASEMAMKLDEMNLKRKAQIKEYEEARNRVRAKRYDSKK